MGRSQRQAGDDGPEPLGQVARKTGGSRSEPTRFATRETLAEKTVAEKLRALVASAGSWGDRRLSGADYVDARRGDLNERRRRLGVE